MPQVLVWPLNVVSVPEAVEGSPLSLPVGLWRRRGLRLEGPMESLDASVLFVLEQSDGGAMLAAAVERLRASGVERVTFEVVGLCPEVYDVVTRLGLRIAGTALIVVTSRPLWTPDHYFPSPSDALY